MVEKYTDELIDNLELFDLEDKVWTLEDDLKNGLYDNTSVLEPLLLFKDYDVKRRSLDKFGILSSIGFNFISVIAVFRASNKVAEMDNCSDDFFQEIVNFEVGNIFKKVRILSV